MLPFYTTRDQNLVVHLYPVDQVFEILMDLFYPRSQYCDHYQIVHESPHWGPKVGPSVFMVKINKISERVHPMIIP